MTLARQLLAGITVSFFALLVGIEAIYVLGAKGTLEEQLDAHANETATALALSLGARAGSLDESLANIMVNPVFDRGYYESIEVRTPGGELVFGRSLESSEIDVPGWFVSLVPIEGPTGEALITAGWKQLGKVVVKIQPGYAYKQLYRTALATLAWLALMFAAALVLVRLYLAGILRPLRDIENAAIAISERNFVYITTQPGTRELQQVTAAMNSLSSRIREAITQEFDRAEHLRKEAFEDALTGQFNRRGFEQSVAAKLEHGGEVHSGALALAFLSGMEDVNRQFGLARGNEILRMLADALAAPGGHGAAIVGRWQGPTLAAFIPNIGAPAARQWAEELCARFPQELRSAGTDASVALSIGVTHFSEDTVTLARLAQTGEGALAEAAKKGGTVLAVLQTGAPASTRDLKKEIQSAIEGGRITLLGQKVLAIADQEVLQVELLCSLSAGDGAVIPAGTFVPVASQHGLLAALDIKVIEQAFAALDRVGTLPWSVSVNVSIQSICDPAFRSALRDVFIRNKQFAWRLIVEITGYAASHSPDQSREFAAELRAAGVRIALDNFDIDRNSMAIVNELRPAYVKLAPSFTQEIAAREDLRFLVSAMVRMLRPLDIPLIAQGVEDAATIPILAELGLAGYQGYAGGRPEALASS